MLTDTFSITYCIIQINTDVIKLTIARLSEPVMGSLSALFYLPVTESKYLTFMVLPTGIEPITVP